MNREEFEDLRRYMSAAEESLRIAYNSMLEYNNNLANGLSTNDAVFDNSNISELCNRILANRDKINQILIKEIDDKLMTM